MSTGHGPHISNEQRLKFTRAVIPKGMEPRDMRDTIPVWLGGDWQRSASGDVIPVLGNVPNPAKQKQFMAHDQDGIRLDAKYGLYGHRPAEEAEGEWCPEGYYKILRKQEESDIRKFYGNTHDMALVKKEVDEALKRMDDAYAERKKNALALRATRQAATDQELVAAGEAAKARLQAAKARDGSEPTAGKTKDTRKG